VSIGRFTATAERGCVAAGLDGIKLAEGATEN